MGNSSYTEDEARKQRRNNRRERERAAVRMRLILSAVILVFAFAAIALAIMLSKRDGDNIDNDGFETPSEVTTEAPTDEEESESAAAAALAEKAIEDAKLLAAGYDYDGAISLLEQIPDYQTYSEINNEISRYRVEKSACVAVDVDKVPHIFYHSLINDTNRAFNVSAVGASMVDGLNAWMCTVEEFDEITQRMYDNGYVFVRLRDLVVQSTDADGTIHFSKNTNLMLPKGKKAVVLSVDDLSYYHSYEAAGYPDKLVLDDQGKVKCQYTDAAGNVNIGDYDVVPRLNAFLEAHPDGAYKGARGLIALTGYNGVFGYRTDIDYSVKLKLQSDQKAWLDKHPEFDYEKDIADAKVIAEALKAEGWEFASHTWGHLSVTNKSAEQLKTDNEKWMNTVANIVGPTDTIIFAHGNDIGNWRDYSQDNDKFAYYKSAGYNFFCNVDGSQPYWVQIRDNYVRQGRINLDGYTLSQAKAGNEKVLNVLGNLFPNPENVFDERRPQSVSTGNSKN